MSPEAWFFLPGQAAPLGSALKHSAAPSASGALICARRCSAGCPACEQTGPSSRGVCRRQACGRNKEASEDENSPSDPGSSWPYPRVGRESSPPRPAKRKPGEGELANIQASKSLTDDHTCHFRSECSALIRPLRKRSSSAGAPAQGHPEKMGIKCSSLHVKCFISSA